MGRSCPLHNAQPFGAKPKLKILISERNGSAMVFYSYWMWSALTCQRFGKRRLVAAIFPIGSGRNKSRHTKGVTSSRTPHPQSKLKSTTPSRGLSSPPFRFEGLGPFGGGVVGAGVFVLAGAGVFVAGGC